MSEQTPPRTTLTINWLQIAGGAGAAVTSAVLLAGLKTLGTYGTLVGAALGSVIASTAAAVYGHYLNASREKVLEAARKARERRTGPVPPAQDEHPDRADPPVEDDSPAPVPGSPAPEPPQRKRFRARNAVLLGVLAFVLSVGGIFVYESVSGQSVAAERQGTTSPVSQGIVGNSLTQAPSTPTPTDTSSATPTDTPTATDTATATSTDTATAESTGGSTDEPTSSGTATDDPTATSSPTDTPTSSSRSTSEPTATSTARSAAQQDASAPASALPTARATDAAATP